MSKVNIIEVSTSRDMDRFINFNYDLYKGNPYAVPELYSSLKDTFNPKKNAALEFCDFKLFLAERDGEIVGRVVGIINNRANETWNRQTVRFGWIDFIDDYSVSEALLKSVADWGRRHNMEDMEGPLGFTDLDREGMLVEGFDQVGTMSTHYNYPYYPKHMIRHGLVKEIDWVERRVMVPEGGVPEKFKRVAEIATRRSNLHIKKLKNMKEVFEEGYGKAIFDLINESYAKLFGYSRLTDKQIDQILHNYLPLLDLNMQTLIMNEKEELVGVGLCMPSIVRALQKSGGKMLPLGWYQLLRSLKFKHEDGVELLLIAVRPDYQGRGVNALLFNDLIPIFNKMGFKWAETNPEMDTNIQVGSQWEYFDYITHKRRRCYSMPL